MYRAVCKRGVVLAVGHHNNRSTLFIQFCQQIHHLSSVLGVQVTGRLIGEYQLGIGYDRTGYRHTLLLTAGKLLRDVLVVAAPAVVIGTVLAWYVNGMWMEQFAERIPISWAVYVLVVMANLVIIVACVLWKSWRIANENPVNSIKSE